MRRPLLLLLSLLPGLAQADVQQQYLKTRTVTQDAINDPDFPSAAGTANDVLMSNSWTNNNQNTRLDSTIIVEFDESIQVGAGYITFQPAILGMGTSSASQTTIQVPGDNVVVSGNSLILNSDPRGSAFGESTTYVVSFDAGVIQDLQATPDTNAAFSVQFTTGDFTSPSLVSIEPEDDEPAYDPTKEIVLTFSEAIQADSSTALTVTNVYARQTPPALSPACNDATQIKIQGNKAIVTLNPATFPLRYCENYRITYAAKCFYDTSPNHNWIESLPSSANWDFWTSCITTYSPTVGSISQHINTNIVLTFQEEVAPGTGNIVLTPLGESPQNFDVNDAAEVTFDGSTHEVTVIGATPSAYLCKGLTMQNCKGKVIDVSIAEGVLVRAVTTPGTPSPGPLPADLPTQLSGSDFRFTLRAADLTPPVITVVSMYGISESVIRVTIRLDESGTTYCRAYDDTGSAFNPVSQGGTDVPTLIDCPSCTKEIKSDLDTPDDPTENFVGSSVYDPVRKYAEHEVDVTGLTDKTFYWVYCYSLDVEIPTANVATSAQMRATERKVRTLDTTPPTFTSFTCEPTPGTEDSITVTLAMNEVGRAYCKVVNRNFISPSPNAVLAEGFYAEVADTNTFTIDVNQITTGLGATGMEALFRKTDYDVYCWSQDGEGYPYHGPNGMADVVACPDNHVTTLDNTMPNMRFVMAESISASQILITLQVDEGAKVWCAAWNADNYVTLTADNYEAKIKGNEDSCMDNKGRQCGAFWIYDLDDLEDANHDDDGVSTQAEYDSVDNWKFNQDIDIIVYNLVEETEYPFIFCYAEDDEEGGADYPNKMMFDGAGSAGPQNVATIKAGIGTIETLDESPPSFTRLEMRDPTEFNNKIIVTFALNEAGTAYCRVTRSDSGETTLRINRILTANFGASVAAPGDVQYITVDKLEDRDDLVLYEAAQYDVYCWALDAAVDTQGEARPNYMLQDYVDTAVGALDGPQGGKTQSVWVKDMTPPELIYVSSESLAEEVIQITLQLNEPGTVWCQPVLTATDNTWLDKDNVAAAQVGGSDDWIGIIKGRSGLATFKEYVHEAYVNVDVEVSKIEKDDGTAAVDLTKETMYNIYCFAEDDWQIEAENSASHSLNFNHDNNNVGAANEITYATSENFLVGIGVVTTLDLTPPAITITGVSSGETTITVTLRLDETGTAWCQAVRLGFNVPTILEILDTNFFTEYTFDPDSTTDTITVELTGYDRPNNAQNSYVSPLVLGTDYDVYCYADDDLCQGCKVTNGVSFAHVTASTIPIRTLDETPPNMRYVSAESIAHDQIQITLQVDEGSLVWCAAWTEDPLLTPSGPVQYDVAIKAMASDCADNKGRQCGTFWIYDLDDLEDGSGSLGPAADDGVDSLSDYQSTSNWRFNQDVTIVLGGLTEETDYPYIYCYAEDDEQTANPMLFDDSTPAANNVHTMKTEIGTIQTLDESPPSFTSLAMQDPTAFNDRIIVTFTLNEAGTAYCRVTRSDSGETTLRINQILSANYFAEVTDETETGYITVTKLEDRDPASAVLYEAAQYDVYCWAKDSAVDTQDQPRPNHMTHDYVSTSVDDKDAPLGGKTNKVWVKDMTPPTMIYVSSEALTEEIIQVTLQLNEPGTVWCIPVVPAVDTDYLDIDEVTSDTYIAKIKSAHNFFREYVHTPYVNVDVEVNKINNNAGDNSIALTKETPYNIYCFAEDDWEIEAEASTQSVNFESANTATDTNTVGTGNEVTYTQVETLRDAISPTGVITLDLTPPAITITGVSSVETQITVTLKLDETGTAWCQAVRDGFNVPTILEILDTNFHTEYTYNPESPTDTITVLLTGYDRPKNAENTYVSPLILGTNYDVYCYADDDLCAGCKVTNGVSFSHVTASTVPIRTLDTTMPHMRFVARESIAQDEILITLQVDEGAKVWCAAWSDDPELSALNYEVAIKSLETNCRDSQGRQCGTWWIYDLDDIIDSTADGVANVDEYNLVTNWKYNQDVDIIVNGLTEETDYPYIYCYAEDDEDPASTEAADKGLGTDPNKMHFNAIGDAGSDNVHTMKTEIGTVQTLDESPPSFTRLALKDPSAVNDRLVVTFTLNEAGTAYCRTTRMDSGETTLRINQILTANYFAEVTEPDQTAYITIDKLDYRDTATLYEAARYDIYCWAKDSAVDTQGMARPNYMIQDYVETFIGETTSTPLGGLTKGVWVVDTTPPQIVVVSREALAEDTIQVTLQLNEPGTIWCQIADKDSSAHTTAPGGLYCRDMDITETADHACYFENWVKGVDRGGAGATVFRADAHVPYQDYDIDLNLIEKVTSTAGGFSLEAQYTYNVYCFAEDDWKLEADNAPSPAPEFEAAPGPNKVLFGHVVTVKNTIGGVLTLDQTAPTFQTITGTQFAESVLTMTMTLDEAGTIWCMPVRTGFAEPSINEILQNNEYNAACGTSACVVTMQGLQSKTQYDIWCYTEDDNVYPQQPNGRKFTGGQDITLSTLDTTPPILTIVSAESPIRTDIRIKIKMEEPGTVWCNSWVVGTAGVVTFDAVAAAGYKSYVGLDQDPGGPINTNVEVVVTDRVEQTQYETFCTAQDASTLNSVNRLVDATTVDTAASIGLITTLDQSPPTFTVLGAKGINENTIQVTFRCNEACRAYCRVTRSDSGESSLSINRILKADYKADQAGGSMDQTIQLSRLEDDSSLDLLERGTLYDTYCWIRDEAVQHSCHAVSGSASCETFNKFNYQSQAYVDTAFGGTPPTTNSGPVGGLVRHVRTPDTTPPNVIFVEAESTEETSITVTLQLDEPGTAYCKAYATTQTADAALFTDLTTGTIYYNTVMNWNNIYKNFEVKVSDLGMETKYYVYCVAEDDEFAEGATTIDPQPTENNEAVPMLTESTGRFTLDLTPPVITVVSIESTAETTATITVRLDEPGTVWCKAVRDRFDAPTINQVIAANFLTIETGSNADFTVLVQNLERDTEYDVYCHARDRGTEVEYGVTPTPGNPGNDVTYDHMLTTKRDIHTMGDSTAPTIVSVMPNHQSTGVDLSPIFTIVFNEDIQASASTAMITLTEDGGGGSHALDITEANNGNCAGSGAAKVFITLTTLTVDFAACAQTLPSNSKWFVSFAEGTLLDESNAQNPVPAFGTSNSYYFTTLNSGG